MAADQRRAPARGAVGDGGLGAIERPHFRRLAQVKEQNLGLAARFLASSGLMRGTLALASSSIETAELPCLCRRNRCPLRRRSAIGQMVRAALDGTMAAARDVAKRLQGQPFREPRRRQGQAGGDPRHCLVFFLDRNTV